MKESVWYVDISNKLWEIQRGFSRRSTVNFHCVPPLTLSLVNVQCHCVFLKCTYNEMLLLLIITLTNAPNNFSVCTVSQQEGAVTMREIKTYWLKSLNSSDWLNFPGAKLRPSGAQGKFKQTLQGRFKSC